MLNLMRKKKKKTEEELKERTKQVIKEDSLEVYDDEDDIEEGVEEIQDDMLVGEEEELTDNIEYEVVTLEEYVNNMQDLYDIFTKMQNLGEKNPELIAICDNINNLINDGRISHSKTVTLKEVRYYIYKYLCIQTNADYDVIEKALDEKEKENNFLAHSKEELEKEVSRLQEDLEIATKDYDALVMSNQEETGNYLKCKEELKVVKAKLEELESKAPDEEAEQQYKTLIENYKSLQLSLDNKSSEVETLQKELADKELSLSEYVTNVNSLEKQIATLQEEKNTYLVKISELEKVSGDFTNIREEIKAEYTKKINDLTEANKNLILQLQDAEKKCESAMTDHDASGMEDELQDRIKSLVEEIKAKDIEIAKLTSSLRESNFEIKRKERELIIHTPNTDLVSQLESSLEEVNGYVDSLTEENVNLLKTKQYLENNIRSLKLKNQSLETKNLSLQKRVSAFVNGEDVNEEDIQETSEILAQAIQPFDKEKASLLLKIGFT